jgi:hypothetical protein
MPRYIVVGDVICGAFSTTVEADNAEQALEMCNNISPEELPGDWGVSSEHELTFAQSADEETE